MKNALIIGSGMVGSALQAQAQQFGYTPIVIPHVELDVTDATAVIQTIVDAKPDVVFHAAALSKVNFCEEHPDEALAVNGKGTANVVAGAEVAGCPLVYFSTDYVFDGSKGEPYTEDDVPSPINAYGKSKLAGEFFVEEYELGNIIRTSGVFGARTDGIVERNFMRVIYDKLKLDSAAIEVVDDQFTAVTYATHLADMCFKLLGHRMPGLVHLTSSGEDSWYGWSGTVAHATGTGSNRLQPVPSKSGDTGTHRPAYSVLKSIYGYANQLVADNSALEGIEEYVGYLKQGSQ